jgi:hypothetical protein
MFCIILLHLGLLVERVARSRTAATKFCVGNLTEEAIERGAERERERKMKRNSERERER